jgi:hypothetical protein
MIGGFVRRGSALAAVLPLLVTRDVGAHALARVQLCIETPLVAALRPARVAAWAEKLEAVEVGNAGTHTRVRIRLYASDGEVDEGARETFEAIAARDATAHRLSVRVEQLVFKAAYHFRSPTVIVVSGFRAHASRHGTGEAVDFKLSGVWAGALADYLRGFPRAGVGLYTNPGTQYVHLDVREPSYHWLDASPPGVHWRERGLADPKGKRRDASWTPEFDLP